MSCSYEQNLYISHYYRENFDIIIKHDESMVNFVGCCDVYSKFIKFK